MTETQDAARRLRGRRVTLLVVILAAVVAGVIWWEYVWFAIQVVLGAVVVAGVGWFFLGVFTRGALYRR